MIADAPWVEGGQNTSFGRKFMWMSHGQKHVAHLTFFRKIPEHLNETSFIVNALPESKTISEIKLLHLLCIVICHFYRSFKVILEGGLLLWAKCISKESKQSGFSPSISVHEKEKKQKRAALFAHYFSWLSVISNRLGSFKATFFQVIAYAFKRLINIRKINVIFFKVVSGKSCSRCSKR